MDVMPPPVRMVQLLAGFQVSQALYAAAKLGVPDALADGPRPIEELAERVGADPAAHARRVRTLASIGVFERQADGSYALGELGPTLTSDGEGSMRDLALMWMETHYAPFGGLVDTVRTGRAAATTFYGQPFFAWLGGQPEHVDRFSRAMGNLTTGIKLGALAAYDFSGAGRIVDLGAANGAVLARVLAGAPAATGVAFDLPEVVEAAESTVKGYELGDRLELRGGDFFEAVPADGDTYLLSMVLHDWNDEQAGRILSNVRAAAQPGSRIVAFELVLPDEPTPHMAQAIDLTMLGMLDGRERTAAEFAALFAEAGLTFLGVTPTPTPISVLEATV
jgi:predicted O-methyltransferase YrrM